MHAQTCYHSTCWLKNSCIGQQQGWQLCLSLIPWRHMLPGRQIDMSSITMHHYMSYCTHSEFTLPNMSLSSPAHEARNTCIPLQPAFLVPRRKQSLKWWQTGARCQFFLMGQD